jgi:hypothetical protein
MALNALTPIAVKTQLDCPSFIPVHDGQLAQADSQQASAAILE